MKYKNITKVCVAIAIGLMTSFGASAAALTGDISFTGSGTFNENGAVDATQLAFGAVTVASGTDDYSGLVGESVTFKTIAFGAPDTVGNLAIDNLWSVTKSGVTFTFDLARISKNSVSGSSRVIEGWGTAETDGAETDAEGFFSLSTNLSGTSITFSAATEVPDSGTTTALLGLSLLGLAGAARRLRK